jgi:hypothetical protein
MLRQKINQSWTPQLIARLPSRTKRTYLKCHECISGVCLSYIASSAPPDLASVKKTRFPVLTVVTPKLPTKNL